MTRSIRTYELTFRDGVLPQSAPCPIILEVGPSPPSASPQRLISTRKQNCREQYGEHTCDKRRSVAYLRTTFPGFSIEPGFTEQDELWLPDERETHAHVAIRARKVIDRAFQEVPSDSTETKTDAKNEAGEHQGASIDRIVHCYAIDLHFFAIFVCNQVMETH